MVTQIRFLVIRSTVVITVFVMLPFWVGCQQTNQTQRKAVTQDDLIEANRNLVGNDANVIRNYIKANNLKFGESQTGLWYHISEQGKGGVVKKGQYITLKYTLSLLDGTLCYSTDLNGPKRFVVGQGGVESGLEEAVLMLRKGSKAKFILPPHLAHGLVGDDDKIPARAIVIYDLEVLSIE